MAADKEKRVVLTFDDGPSYTTPQILEVLDTFGVTATFFVLGRQVLRHPDLLKKIHESGHSIGNHGFSHSYIRSRLGWMRDEIVRTHDIVAKSVGAGPSLFRPPYGLVGPWLAVSLKGLGYKTVLWNCDGEDWNPRVSAQKIARRILSCVQPGSIILLHDGCGGRDTCDRSRTVDALRIILTDLKAKGFEFALP